MWSAEKTSKVSLCHIWASPEPGAPPAPWGALYLFARGAPTQLGRCKSARAEEEEEEEEVEEEKEGEEEKEEEEEE